MTIKDHQAQEYADKKIQETVPDEYRHDEQIYDADDIKYAYKQAYSDGYSDGYTACEQSKEDSEATLIQGWVAKLRELFERLVVDGDIEPIYVSVDEIINRVKEEK